MRTRDKYGKIKRSLKDLADWMSTNGLVGRTIPNPADAVAYELWCTHYEKVQWLYNYTLQTLTVEKGVKADTVSRQHFRIVSALKPAVEAIAALCESASKRESDDELKRGFLRWAIELRTLVDDENEAPDDSDAYDETPLRVQVGYVELDYRGADYNDPERVVRLGY